MASYGKKKRTEIEEGVPEDNEVSSNEEYEDVESDSSSSDEEINEEIQVEFEALPPQDTDFHGIRKLLQQLFLKSNVNLSELSELIISQNFIGCVVKQSESQLMEEMEDDDDDDDDIFGFISVLSVSGLQHKPCMQQVLDVLHAKCKECADASTQAEFNQFLTSGQHKLGLLLNERFVNIPPQLAPPLHRSLQSDLAKAGARNEKYKVDYFILMCKSYQMTGSPKKKKKNKGGGDYEEDTQSLFANAEDEIFYKESVINFSYSITEESDTAIAGRWSSGEQQLQTYRTVMIVPSSKMEKILMEIEETLTG